MGIFDKDLITKELSLEDKVKQQFEQKLKDLISFELTLYNERIKNGTWYDWIESVDSIYVYAVASMSGPGSTIAEIFLRRIVDILCEMGKYRDRRKGLQDINIINNSFKSSPSSTPIDGQPAQDCSIEIEYNYIYEETKYKGKFIKWKYKERQPYSGVIKIDWTSYVEMPDCPKPLFKTYIF